MLTQVPLTLIDISSLQRAVGSSTVQQGTAVVFAHGIARGNPGPGGAGAVIALAGDIQETISKFCGVTTNDIAEYTGLILGLERALELGFKQVEVRMDSDSVVKQINGFYRVKVDRLIPLYHQAMSLSRKFAEFKIIHIQSEFNKEADRLANQAMDQGLTGSSPLS